ncbi:hypothetical protein [Burkholderia sp. PU8-34]
MDDAERNVGEMETFAAKFCEQMLTLSCALDESQLLPSNLAVQALRDVFFGGRGSVMAKAIGHGPRQVNRYLEGAAPAPLNLFLRAACVTGATAEQIFATAQFDCETALEEAEFDLYRARHRRRLGYEELRRALEAAFAEPSGASVRSVAVRLGVDPAVIWRREPALASRLSLAYAVHVAEESRKKKAAFERSVLELAEQFRALGTRPSLDEMKEALGSSACFLNPWKRQVVARTLYALFGNRAN